MRLINTRTGTFVEVHSPKSISYAILSHVWGDNELSFTGVCDILKKYEDGLGGALSPILTFLPHKIQKFCEVAQSEGYDFGWIDTCCIDKTDSTELSEAINSMYNWYRHSAVCYVYLHDITDESSHLLSGSVWFSRGWTLQELIAPNVVNFYTSSWTCIGSKHMLADIVEKACNVNRDVLTFRKQIHEVSIARRMSWAASRRTTREEDRAYSIMGLFGVNMPMMYGEGGQRAFIRLQGEIIRLFPWDHTIFAWGNQLNGDSTMQRWNSESSTMLQTTGSIRYPRSASIEHILPLGIPHGLYSPLDRYLLATSPTNFREWSSHLVALSQAEYFERFGLPSRTSNEAGMWLPMIKLRFSSPQYSQETRPGIGAVPTHIALLSCKTSDNDIVALLLREEATAPGNYRVGSLVYSQHVQNSYSEGACHYVRAISITHTQLSLCRKLLRIMPVNIQRHPQVGLEEEETESANTWDKFCLPVRHPNFTIHTSCTFPYPGSPPGIIWSLQERGVVGVEAFFSLRDIMIFDLCHGTRKVVHIGIGRCCRCTDQIDHIGLMAVSVPKHHSAVWAERTCPHGAIHLRDWTFRADAVSQQASIDLSEEGVERRVELRFVFRHFHTIHSAADSLEYQLRIEVLSF